MVSRLLACVGLVLTGSSSLLAQPPTDTPKPLALVVTYADGRTAISAFRATFGFWTRAFPRLSDAPPPYPVLDVMGTRDGDEAVVTVSLLKSATNPSERVTVATVRVSREEPADVSALARYGIAPIRLSVILVGTLAVLRTPNVGVASGQIEVAVSQPTWRPLYRVTVTNHAQASVRAVQFLSMRDGRKDMSVRQKDAQDRPLIAPGATYVFDVSLSPRDVVIADGGRTPESWPDWDEFLMTAVIWDDGLVEGDDKVLASERQLYDAKLIELHAVRQWLADAASLTMTMNSARRDYEERTRGLGGFVRAAVLADISRFGRSHPDADAATFGEWVADAARRYAEWETRLLTFTRQSGR